MGVNDVDDHEVQVREHALPGSARLFEMTTAGGSAVMIATEPAVHGRVVAITPAGADDPAATVHLTSAESATVAALLSGIRFVSSAQSDAQPVDAANPRTVTLAANAPVVGRRLEEVDTADPTEARVVAVIRDDTDDVIESDPGRTLQPGDRLVVIGRPGAVDRLVATLLG